MTFTQQTRKCHWLSSDWWLLYFRYSTGSGRSPSSCSRWSTPRRCSLMRAVCWLATSPPPPSSTSSSSPATTRFRWVRRLHTIFPVFVITTNNHHKAGLFAIARVETFLWTGQKVVPRWRWNEANFTWSLFVIFCRRHYIRHQNLKLCSVTGCQLECQGKFWNASTSYKLSQPLCLLWLCPLSFSANY